MPTDTPVSARATMDREESQREIARLKQQVLDMGRTIIGLGSIVAEARELGFIAAKRA